MIRLMQYALVLFLTLPTPPVAQEQLQPFARVDVGMKEVAIGKPVTVTVTLLVPTMFRVQPEFPDYDGLNVIIRTAGVNMLPVNEYIDGKKWSGTSQTYRFYPMKPGEFVFESARVSGIYSDPVDTTSATAEFDIDGFAFSAVVPAGAEDLDPLIVADALTLEQSWEGAVDGIKEGEALTRSVSASIKGSSALFLPGLIQQHDSELVKAYPQRHELADNDPGKSMGGSRTDSVTYVAQHGGKVVFPDIAIRWFNAATGKIETAKAQGRSITIDAPTMSAEPPVSRKQVLVFLGLLLCLVAVGWSYRKYLHPVLTSEIDELRLRWITSEAYAARKLVLAIRNHDLDEVFRRTQLWLERQKVTDTENRQVFVNALLEVGKERFGNGPEANWLKLEQAFRRMRKAAKSRGADQNRRDLPVMNPF